MSEYLKLKILFIEPLKKPFWITKDSLLIQEIKMIKKHESDFLIFIIKGRYSNTIN